MSANAMAMEMQKMPVAKKRKPPIVDDAVLSVREMLKTRYGGRSKKFTDKVVKELLDNIENGATFRDACKLSDISESTFNQWRNDYPVFAEAVNKALAGYKQYHVENIKKASEKTWTASAWMLERRYKDEYSQRVDVNKQVVNVSLQIGEQSLDALAGYIDADIVPNSSADQLTAEQGMLEGEEKGED